MTQKEYLAELEQEATEDREMEADPFDPSEDFDKPSAGDTD